MKIFSKSTNELLHIYIKNDFKKGRVEIVPENNFLQLATITLNQDQTFKPHKHIWKDIKYKKIIAQESWVVVTGSVKVDYYDIDGSFISSQILKKGDCTITLQGGHNYTCLEKNTTVYEFKSGPYEGVLKDKVFI
jgi:cupin fold WbuC family metalloprotein